MNRALCCPPPSTACITSKIEQFSIFLSPIILSIHFSLSYIFTILLLLLFLFLPLLLRVVILKLKNIRYLTNELFIRTAHLNPPPPPIPPVTDFVVVSYTFAFRRLELFELAFSVYHSHRTPIPIFFCLLQDLHLRPSCPPCLYIIPLCPYCFNVFISRLPLLLPTPDNPFVPYCRKQPQFLICHNIELM